MDINRIYEPIKNELVLVEKEIQSQIDSIVEAQSSHKKRFLKQIMNYLFEIPGKLLRPSLVLLSAKAVTGGRLDNTDRLIKLAAAVEFVHSASLIHDDIIDESEYRRTRITLNRQFGNQIAVLVGDVLYSQFFSILIDLHLEQNDRRRILLKSFSNTTKKLCIGETIEHKIRTDDEEATLDEYLRVIENKTASLFSVSCMNGGLLNGANERISEALSRYGLCVGYSFQIVDDFLDNDSILRLDSGMIGRAEQYAEEAKNEIKALPQSDAKKTLLRIPEFIMDRLSVYNH